MILPIQYFTTTVNLFPFNADTGILLFQVCSLLCSYVIFNSLICLPLIFLCHCFADSYNNSGFQN